MFLLEVEIIKYFQRCQNDKSHRDALSGFHICIWLDNYYGSL